MADLPTFRLRFPVEDVPEWAARYQYADDQEVEAIGRRVRERGWYTRDEFLTVARWKTPRSQSRCRRNAESTVREATRIALAASDEHLRIGVLTLLSGVEMPTASVLLHLAHRDPYPIIDFRAVWSLGVAQPPIAYSFEYWWAYTQTCRALAADAGVSMRTLDRALWQYSKEHQGRPTVPSASPGTSPASASRPSGRPAGPSASMSARAGGPVEMRVRQALRAPATLQTHGQRKPFVLQAIDAGGIVLLLGRNEAHTRVTWACLESIVPFLRARGGWVPAGGQHSVAGEPGTLDEHLKRYLKRDVARWLVRILAEADVAEVDDGRPLRLRLRRGL
jgi:hypothetical protein